MEFLENFEGIARGFLGNPDGVSRWHLGGFGGIPVEFLESS